MKLRIKESKKVSDDLSYKVYTFGPFEIHLHTNIIKGEHYYILFKDKTAGSFYFKELVKKEEVLAKSETFKSHNECLLISCVHCRDLIKLIKNAKRKNAKRRQALLRKDNKRSSSQSS